MSVAELNEKVLAISEAQHEASIHIDQLVVAMIDMDEEGFEKILNNLFLRFGFENTITGIVYPFLEKIGVLWQTEHITPAHEHFISNLIRQKLIVGIDGLPLPPRTSKKVLLFLPENELHELGLLFYHYLTRKAAIARIFRSMSSSRRSGCVCSYARSRPYGYLYYNHSLSPITDYLTALNNDFAETPILASGFQIRTNLDVLKGISGLLRRLLNLKFLLTN